MASKRVPMSLDCDILVAHPGVGREIPHSNIKRELYRHGVKSTNDYIRDVSRLRSIIGCGYDPTLRRRRVYLSDSLPDLETISLTPSGKKQEDTLDALLVETRRKALMDADIDTVETLCESSNEGKELCRDNGLWKEKLSKNGLPGIEVTDDEFPENFTFNDYKFVVKNRSVWELSSGSVPFILLYDALDMQYTGAFEYLIDVIGANLSQKEYHELLGSAYNRKRYDIVQLLIDVSDKIAAFIFFTDSSRYVEYSIDDAQELSQILDPILKTPSLTIDDIRSVIDNKYVIYPQVLYGVTTVIIEHNL